MYVSFFVCAVFDLGQPRYMGLATGATKEELQPYVVLYPVSFWVESSLMYRLYTSLKKTTLR